MHWRDSSFLIIISPCRFPCSLQDVCSLSCSIVPWYIQYKARQCGPAQDRTCKSVQPTGNGLRARLDVQKYSNGGGDGPLKVQAFRCQNAGIPGGGAAV